MGLPDTSPTPKKDSMGMDYIPVYEGEAEEGNTVTVSPGKLQRTGVRSELVKRQVISRPVRAPGTIQVDERRLAVVSLRSDAFVDKVENVTTGDHVRKGQPLVRVYSPEIAAASAQYLSIINEPGGLGSGGRPLVFEGARRRLENLNVPPDVVAEIERTRKVPLTITWVAPRDGLVLERNAVEGMKAPAGQVLFQIADHSVVWVLADVTELDLALVAEGQPAVVRVRGYPDRSFAGKIARIYPHLNKETRTARIRIELPNPDGILRPEMYVEVEVATGAGLRVIAVPDAALIDTGARQVVLIDKGEGRFEPREVKTGARGSDYVEIRDGVAEGERVVTAANFLIDAESNLKAALQSMAVASTPGAAEEKRP
jgi:membrane fusion protein, copper/silver efflux system